MLRRRASHRIWFCWSILSLATFAAIYVSDLRIARLWANSLMLAAGANAIAIPLGSLAAAILVKTNAPGRRLAALLFAGMLLIPLFLIAGAWDAGFGDQGWYTLRTNPHLTTPALISGWRAAVWIHGLAAVPWVALIVGAALLSVERELEEDALLVMSPLRVLCHVTLPRIWPAIGVAALWVAIVAIAEISITDFYRVRIVRRRSVYAGRARRRHLRRPFHRSGEHHRLVAGPRALRVYWPRPACYLRVMRYAISATSRCANLGIGNYAPHAGRSRPC